MKKNIALSVALVSVMLLASGCAQSNDTTTESKDTTHRVEIQTEVETEIIETEDTSDTHDTHDTHEVQVDEDTLAVEPIPFETDPENIAYSDVAIEISKGSIEGNEITFTLYDYEQFELSEINNLGYGDTIVIDGDEIEIETIERNELDEIEINGGHGSGVVLTTDGGGVLYVKDSDGLKTYQEIGEFTIEISDDFTYVDSSDIDGEPIIYNKEDLAGIDYYGTPDNMVLSIVDGKAVYMEKMYTH